LPRTIIGIKIKLSRVLDLTNSAVRKRLGIEKKLLIQMGWEYEQEVLNQEAVTQVIGRLARDVGFEGILVPSAHGPTERT
jgi:RES domain-containing protein